MFVPLLIVLSFINTIALDNVVVGSFHPTLKENFNVDLFKTGLSNAICSINFLNGRLTSFSPQSKCDGPYLTSYKDGHFKIFVGIRDSKPENTYYLKVDNISESALQYPHDVNMHTHIDHTAHIDHIDHTDHTDHIVYHPPSHHVHSHVHSHIHSPFQEPSLNFLSRKSNPLKGRELLLKKRHILKSNNLAEFDWELINDPGCQFVGPHVNATCNGCVGAALPFNGPSSTHHLCVLNDDDMSRWHREDFLAVYEVRREQFIDAFVRYKDQIEHYNRIKVVYNTAKKAYENQTLDIQTAYAPVVAAYKLKADEVFNQTKAEYELVHQLHFAMQTAKEIYKAASQAFIDGLYNTDAYAPVAGKHLSFSLNKHKIRGAKPVLQGIREILSDGGWKGKTLTLMRTIDRQIKHLLK